MLRVIFIFFLFDFHQCYTCYTIHLQKLQQKKKALSEQDTTGAGTNPEFVQLIFGDEETKTLRY